MDPANFLEHSLAWIRGETFESQLMAVMGGVLVATGIAAWRLGTTPAARSLILPLLLLGGILVVAGVSGAISNGRRIASFTQAFKANPAQFIASEKARVEGFESIYNATLIGASISLAAAAAIFWLTHSPSVRGAAIGLVLLGLSALMIDFFSKERADVYYDAILTELRDSADPTMPEDERGESTPG